MRRPELKVPSGPVFAAVQRTPGRPPDMEFTASHERGVRQIQIPFLMKFSERANKSLEHVFSLFATVLPRDPVNRLSRTHTEDRAARPRGGIPGQRPAREYTRTSLGCRGTRHSQPPGRTGSGAGSPEKLLVTRIAAIMIDRSRPVRHGSRQDLDYLIGSSHIRKTRTMLTRVALCSASLRAAVASATKTTR